MKRRSICNRYIDELGYNCALSFGRQLSCQDAIAHATRPSCLGCRAKQERDPARQGSAPAPTAATSYSNAAPATLLALRPLAG